MRKLRSNSREKERQEATENTKVPSVPPRSETTSAMVNRHLSMDSTAVRKEVTHDIFGPLNEIQSSSVQDQRQPTLQATVPVIPLEQSTATVASQMADQLRNIPPEEANQLLRSLMIQVQSQSSSSSTSRPVISTREFAAAPEDSLQYSSSASYTANIQRQHIRNAQLKSTDDNNSSLE